MVGWFPFENKNMGVVGHLYYNIDLGVYHSHAWSGYQKLDPRANNLHTDCFSPLAEQVENLSFSELVKTNFNMNRTQT